MIQVFNLNITNLANSQIVFGIQFFVEIDIAYVQFLAKENKETYSSLNQMFQLV
jgi:hypothetical protein